MLQNTCTLEKVLKEGKLILLPSELTESHHPDAQQHTYDGTGLIFPELEVELASGMVTFCRLQHFNSVNISASEQS